MVQHQRDDGTWTDGRPGQQQWDEENAVREKIALSVLPDAARGDRDKALLLVGLLASIVERGSRIKSKGLREWLATGLTRIRFGDSIEAAFGIPARKRGKRTEGEVIAAGQESFRRAYRVECIREQDRLSVERAAARVAEEEGLTERAVMGSWRKHHKLAKHEIEMQKKHLGHFHFLSRGRGRVTLK